MVSEERDGTVEQRQTLLTGAMISSVAGVGRGQVKLFSLRCLIETWCNWLRLLGKRKFVVVLLELYLISFTA